MHETAHHEPRNRTAGQVQRRAFLHAQMLDQPSLGEEVCRQLHGAAETRPDHGGAHASIQPAEPFRLVDLPQPIERVLVLVLRADW